MLSSYRWRDSANKRKTDFEELLCDIEGGRGMGKGRRRGKRGTSLRYWILGEENYLYKREDWRQKVLPQRTQIHLYGAAGYRIAINVSLVRRYGRFWTWEARKHLPPIPFHLPKRKKPIKSWPISPLLGLGSIVGGNYIVRRPKAHTRITTDAKGSTVGQRIRIRTLYI